MSNHGRPLHRRPGRPHHDDREEGRTTAERRWQPRVEGRLGQTTRQQQADMIRTGGIKSLMAMIQEDGAEGRESVEDRWAGAKDGSVVFVGRNEIGRPMSEKRRWDGQKWRRGSGWSRSEATGQRVNSGRLHSPLANHFPHIARPLPRLPGQE